MHKYFLNTLWEFTRTVEEDRDGFIQKALKVCKTFKVKSLKTPRLDLPAKNRAYNLFYEDMRETKEELQSVTVSQASAIISRNGKKLRLATRR